MYLPNRQRLLHGNFNHSRYIELEICREHFLCGSMLSHKLDVSVLSPICRKGTLANAHERKHLIIIKRGDFDTRLPETERLALCLLAM